MRIFFDIEGNFFFWFYMLINIIPIIGFITLLFIFKRREIGADYGSNKYGLNAPKKVPLSQEV